MKLFKKMHKCRSSPCGVVAYVLDCNIVVRKFELQSCFHVHFRTDKYLWERYEPPWVKIVPLQFFYKDRFGIK